HSERSPVRRGIAAPQSQTAIGLKEFEWRHVNAVHSEGLELEFARRARRDDFSRSLTRREMSRGRKSPPCQRARQLLRRQARREMREEVVARPCQRAGRIQR